MRKSLLLAAAGAAVLFTGCQDPVMEERRYVPAPEQDNPEVMTTQPVAPAPAAAAQARPAAAAKFEPMVDVSPTGGVDSAAAAKHAGSAAGGYYTVAPNDNPAKIAKKLNVKLSALMAANNLTPESAKKLQVGQKLVVPAGGKAVKSAAPAAKSAKAAPAVKSAPAATEAIPADGKYVVKSGDSAEKIAKKYGVKLNDLLKANNLTAASARRLQVGQKLVIPGKTADSAAVAPAAAPADAVPASAVPAADTTVAVSATAPASENITVTVTESKGAGAPTAAAATGTGDLVPVFPEADESIESFARSHNVTPDDIRKLNSNVTDKVTRDMVIYLPNR